MSSNETQSNSPDLIVLGSGAAGFAAAVTAANAGLKVLMLEKDSVYGGASAISGGTIWVPGNDQAVREGLESSLDSARTYLGRTIGHGASKPLIETFLARGREALKFLEQNSELRFKVRPHSPDYHMEVEGSSEGGRALEVLEYDGRKLGPSFKDLRKPPEGMLLFGGMMVNRADVQSFLTAGRSIRSLAHCARLLTRYAVDRLSNDRGTRLVVGNALVARLAATAFGLGVELRLRVEVRTLILEKGEVRGVVAILDGRERRILAPAGVVVATGGFAASPLACTHRPSTGGSHRTMSPPCNTGGGHELAIRAGGTLGSELVSNFYWAPVSVLTRSDGWEERFPHLVTDRAKPGLIAINRDGRRFVNEADSYHRFVLAMIEQPERNAPCHLICDARALKAYGLGLARPGPSPSAALQKSGYLFKADSIAALGSLIGVEADTLCETVRRYNENAAKGTDPEFGKGSTSYNRSMGDPSHRPNPCLAPVVQAPFYAIQLVTGDLGSAQGLVTDKHARVLDQKGRAIAGLYAVGNDMNSVMNGTYPGPGITLGPALTFGYLAARHACARRRPSVKKEFQDDLRDADLHS
jgi:succinate dehydrogenase/fumarate reductase flavoprotein subunit